MSGFVLHPDAFADLDEIWEFIATDNLSAADGVLEAPLFPSLIWAMAAPILLPGHCVFSPCEIF